MSPIWTRKFSIVPLGQSISSPRTKTKSELFSGLQSGIPSVPPILWNVTIVFCILLPLFLFHLPGLLLLSFQTSRVSRGNFKAVLSHIGRLWNRFPLSCPSCSQGGQQSHLKGKRYYLVLSAEKVKEWSVFAKIFTFWKNETKYLQKALSYVNLLYVLFHLKYWEVERQG